MKGNENKKVVVVGAGIAGLTAGIYAARSGFDVTIIEQHTIVGGMCTSWKRKGYFFEGAINWLTGSAPGTALNNVWRDTGALSDQIKVFYHDPFHSVEWEGKTIKLYRDIDKTCDEFKEISPKDTKAIEQFRSDVKALTKMRMPVMDVKGVKAEKPVKMPMKDMMKMVPSIPKMRRLSQMTCGEYAEQFQHEGIRFVMSFMPGEYVATSLIFTAATLAAGDGGYPEGGSIPMVQRMSKTYKELGGTLLLNTKVKQVLIENGAVTGVELEDRVLKADAVIITQEILAAVDKLFESTPKEAWIEELRQKIKPAAGTFVGIGIRASVPETPDFMLDEPIICADITYHNISFTNYSRFKDYAPEGGTTLTTCFMDETYDYWKKVREEGRYEEEKQKVAEQLIKVISKKYPQAEGKIEVIDIATPLTYERYTGASRGSWMAVMGRGEANKEYPCELEEAKGVYFAGHRAMLPGGLPVALSSGRKAAQKVCRQFNVMFR